MRKLISCLVPAVLLVWVYLPFQDTVSGHEGAGHLVTTERRQIGDNPDSLIWTWGRFHGDKPLSVGVTFTEPALDEMFTAPPDGDFPYLLPHLTAPEIEPARVYNLALPDKVRNTTPFDHVGWFANAHSHASWRVFDGPHVDVHFFTITVEDRMAMSGQLDDPKLLTFPPVGFLPADVCLPLAVFPPPCQPFTTLTETDIPGSNDTEQGLHWIDSVAREQSGEPFRQIFIYGSYDGEVNFWEPMIPKQFFEDIRSSLDNRPSMGKAIAWTFTMQPPETVLETSYYPTHYTLRYDADAGVFTVSLDHFVLRTAAQSDQLQAQGR